MNDAPHVEEILAGSVKEQTLLRFRGRTRRVVQVQGAGSDACWLWLLHEETGTTVLACVEPSQVLFKVI